VGAVGTWIDQEVTDAEAHTYWTRTIGNGFTGKFSKPAVGWRSGRPVVLSVSPASGEPQAQQVFSAVLEGPGPLTYAWSFGQGIDHQTSTEPTPVFNLGNAGFKRGSLVVSNPTGSTEFFFDCPVGPQEWIGPWPFHGGDIRSSRSSSATGPLTADNVWTLPGLGMIAEPPVIDAEGTAYVCCGNVMRAISPGAGIIWSYYLPPGQNFLTAPAVSPMDWIYAGADDSKLYAVTKHGATRWTYDFGLPITRHPLVDPNSNVYAGHSWGLKVLDKGNQLKWSYSSGAAYFRDFCMGPGGVAYIDRAIDPAGSAVWQESGYLGQSAVGADGTLYYGNSSGQLCAAYPTGELMWIYEHGAEIISSPAVAADGTIVFGALSGEIIAMNPDGTLKWSQDSGAMLFGSPVIDGNGKVFFGSSDNSLRALDAGGNPLWAVATSDDVCQPAIAADGSIIAGSVDGTLIVVSP
jgi:outer membrane protein assembly factor BamB